MQEFKEEEIACNESFKKTQISVFFQGLNQIQEYYNNFECLSNLLAYRISIRKTKNLAFNHLQEWKKHI